MNDELVWDNGTAFPEPCIDRIADTVGKVCLTPLRIFYYHFSSNLYLYLVFLLFQYEALAWLCGGLGFFASLGFLAVWNDKASKIPFVSILNWTSFADLLYYVLYWII